MDNSERACGTCRKWKDLTAFKLTGTGYSKTCVVCLQRIGDHIARKKGKENIFNGSIEPDVDRDDEQADTTGLSQLKLADFLATLESSEDTALVAIEALVDISTLEMEGRELADNLAALIWENLKYRFV